MALMFKKNFDDEIVEILHIELLLNFLIFQYENTGENDFSC